MLPAEGAITIRDLLRHTSGMTYEFRGAGPVQKMYMAAKLYRRSQSSAEQVSTLAKMPLVDQPGTHWEYGRSTDVLGRLVEVLSGSTLGEYFREAILAPLGMVDTGFHVPREQQHRLAEAFPKDPDTGATVQLAEAREPPKFESGGGGLMSTAEDYARFLLMLLNGGTLNGSRLLSRKTIEYMTSDHLGPITGAPDLLLPGYGFGLGFAVRLHARFSPYPGIRGAVFLGRAGGNDVLGRSRGRVVCCAADPGAGPTRILRHPVPGFGLRRRIGLKSPRRLGPEPRRPQGAKASRPLGLSVYIFLAREDSRHSLRVHGRKQRFSNS